MKMQQIQGKEAMVTECKGHQFILTWNEEGFWMVDYITECGDIVGVEDAFTLKAAAYLIESYVHDVLDSTPTGAI